MIKRTAAVVLCCLWPLGSCAFELQYGTLFSVPGITVKNGVPVLPLAKKKYANVKVLDRATYDVLKACSSRPGPCRQESRGGALETVSLRPAQTRPGMWIAQLAVDRQWLLTFLIFENKQGVGVVVPEPLQITDDTWRVRLETYLADETARVKQTEQTHAVHQ